MTNSRTIVALLSALSVLAITACAKPHISTSNVGVSHKTILMIGDSITWGQGLTDGEKIKDYLTRAYRDQGDTADAVVVAHSGAIIGAGVQGTHTPEPDGEVPSDLPSILEQVDEAQSRGPYDLIVLSACINDIGVNTVVSPWPAGDGKISDAVNQYCGTDLQTLLQKINDKLVMPGRTKVVVMNYFPILSPTQSERLPNVAKLAYSLFSTWTGASDRELRKIDQTPHIMQNDCPVLVFRCNAKHHAQWFEQESRARITKTVKDLNNAAFIPVDPKIPEQESAYADSSAATSWIWEVTFAPSCGLVAIDDARKSRIPDCKGERFCVVASIGHPNRCGEASYAQAIIDAAGLHWHVPKRASCATVPA